jgi:hypothetical protein
VDAGAGVSDVEVAECAEEEDGGAEEEVLEAGDEGAGFGCWCCGGGGPRGLESGSRDNWAAIGEEETW